MSEINQKVVLITGASAGIGRATAEAFAARGAAVVISARRKEELEQLAGEIKSRGGKASVVVTDVAIAKDVERMVAHTIETFGRLDYAVNNAAIEGKLAAITDLPEEEWDRVMDTNLKSVFLCLQQEARAMLAGGRHGAIVNVGSVNSFLGFPTGSAYVTFKARTDRAHHVRFRGAGAAGNPRESPMSRICRHPDASPRPCPDRRRALRQTSQRARSSTARRPPRGNRADDRVPMLRRGQLHHRRHADARRRIHADGLRASLAIIVFRRASSAGALLRSARC